jgi:hypothetical protein
MAMTHSPLGVAWPPAAAVGATVAATAMVGAAAGAAVAAGAPAGAWVGVVWVGLAGTAGAWQAASTPTGSIDPTTSADQRRN